MNQQERIYNKIQEETRFVSRVQDGGRLWGKTYAAAIQTGIQYALENQWIPVEEGLPAPDIDKMSEWCMVIFNSRQTLPIPGRFNYIKNSWVDKAGFNIYKVLYWMPIPKLPVVRGDDIYPNIYNTEP